MQPGKTVRRDGRRGGHEQLELLRPRTRHPQWQQLPNKVRHELMPLLVRMLREALVQQAHPASDERTCGDEPQGENGSCLRTQSGHGSGPRWKPPSPLAQQAHQATRAGENDDE